MPSPLCSLQIIGSVKGRVRFNTIRPGLELFSTGNLNYDWADDWIRSMKREANLAPATIRHRHGALARCFDWMLRKHPDILAQNPLRLLKRGDSFDALRRSPSVRRHSSRHNKNRTGP